MKSILMRLSFFSLVLCFIISACAPAPAPLAGGSLDLISYSYSNEIYVLSLDHSFSLQLANLQEQVQDLHWSPDGSVLLFSTCPEKICDIWRVDANGTNLKNLTADKTFASENPAWSPDGRMIAFSAHVTMQGRQIFIMRADGSGLRQLTHEGDNNLSPAWSPDGKTIVFSSQSIGINEAEITTIDVKSGQVQQLTDNDTMDLFPAWSPDGSMIAFLSGADFNSPMSLDLMNSNGTRLETLNQAAKDVGKDFAWSPGGDAILFSAIPEGARDSQVFRVEVGDGTLHQETQDQDAGYLPQWAPSGARFAYIGVSKTFGESNIFIDSGDSQPPVQLTDIQANIVELAWVPIQPPAATVIKTPTSLGPPVVTVEIWNRSCIDRDYYLDGELLFRLAPGETRKIQTARGEHLRMDCRVDTDDCTSPYPELWNYSPVTDVIFPCEETVFITLGNESCHEQDYYLDGRLLVTLRPEGTYRFEAAGGLHEVKYCVAGTDECTGPFEQTWLHQQPSSIPACD